MEQANMTLKTITLMFITFAITEKPSSTGDWTEKMSIMIETWRKILLKEEKSGLHLKNFGRAKSLRNSSFTHLNKPTLENLGCGLEKYWENMKTSLHLSKKLCLNTLQKSIFALVITTRMER